MMKTFMEFMENQRKEIDMMINGMESMLEASELQRRYGLAGNQTKVVKVRRRQIPHRRNSYATCKAG